jgi:hypothetical protein
MRRLLLCAAIATAILSPLACNLADQLSAEEVMLGTLFSTPEVTISPAAFLGADGGLPDAGPAFTLPQQTAALAFFGTRQDEKGQPAPIANATLRLETGNAAAAVALESQALGTYSLTSSGNDGKLRYQPGTDYRFTAVVGSERFTSSVKDAPPVERIEALHPASGYVQHPQGQVLRLQRPAVSPGRERALGFVTVVPVSSDGQQGRPTYSTVPSPLDPLAFLQLLLDTSEQRSATIDIPTSAFPEREATYLVIFQSASLGGPETGNLFFGSALLVGAADIGVVRTR